MKKNVKCMITETEYLEIIPEPIGNDDCEVCAHCDIDYVDEKTIYI